MSVAETESGIPIMALQLSEGQVSAPSARLGKGGTAGEGVWGDVGVWGEVAGGTRGRNREEGAIASEHKGIMSVCHDSILPEIECTGEKKLSVTDTEGGYVWSGGVVVFGNGCQPWV